MRLIARIQPSAPSSQAICPVISARLAGRAHHVGSSSVGATSSEPPVRRVYGRCRRSAERGETGSRVCAVYGPPVSGSFISSQLP